MAARKVITIDDENYALTDDFLSNVLETAVEGACSYWADVNAENAGGEDEGLDGARDFDVSDYLEDENEEREDVAEARSLDAPFYTAATFLVSKDASQGGTLDLEGIADAIERIANQEVEVAPAIREVIIAAIEEDDPSEIDAEAADCIVQVGLFDEILFS
ncbi:hypothetical protein Q8A64_03530 [Oxalobacteraceae bacterium R-40]|uniref:Uncharacterized protein n=1 Tax=Keguizhuia sedimenti TaxID=3064264 RepID=A0ABU1BMC2_9BURK|nr:hypothetical protein [Oxalobacteraceae bacterium R-40]